MKNIELYRCLEVLAEIAPQCRGRIGYAVARNIRKFEESLTEYIAERDKLILKLGENGVIKPESPNLPLYLQQVKVFDEIENNPEVFKITEKDLQESDLPADIMLGLSFMIEEGER